jgi:hypothetical protein
MTNALDQKTYWGLLETVRWISTRDDERVAAMWDMSEEDAIAPAMLGVRAQFDLPWPRGLAETDSDADREAAASQGNGRSSRIDGAFMMGPSQALDDLHRKVHGRRVQMTAIRCDGNSEEQIPVPPVELNDLIFRLSPGHRVAPVGLWSRSRDSLVWRSPQFLRADVVRVWPARNTKTAAVCKTILGHLQKITSPEAPLTKLQALQRCLVEVPNAYSEAFKRAWAELEPSCKRGRGKHGPRVH